MNYLSILESLPEEFRLPLLRLIEALQQDLREQFAVRRTDFEQLQGAVGELAGGYERNEQRFNRLDTALARLAEAQEGTEQRIGRIETALVTLAEAQVQIETALVTLAEAQLQIEERTGQRMDRLATALAQLAEAQQRTEQRVGELAEAQQRTEQRVGELAEAQQRTEQRVGELAEAQQRTEQRVEELVEGQQRTEQRMDRLAIALSELAEAQKRTEQRVEELVEAQNRMEQRVGRLETVVAELGEAQKRTEAALEALTVRVDNLTKDVAELTGVVRRAKLDELRGFFLEHRYRERVHAYLGTVLRKVRVVSWDEIEDQVDEALPEQERKDLLLLDLLVRGRARTRPDLPEVWVALEISGQIDDYDVIRAQRRAAILRRLGYASVAAVAGEEITGEGELSAQTANVAVVQNGNLRFWDAALTQLPAM